MTDRPIIFSAPMVRALLDGRKTQTRRVIKPQPSACRWKDHLVEQHADGVYRAVKTPYSPGDRLWVREVWAHDAPDLDTARRGIESGGVFYGPYYRADAKPFDVASLRWRPSIHMPRWASRLTLTVSDVRVQRLQDITEDDARAEGLERIGTAWGIDGIKGSVAVYERTAFRVIWNSIHGPGAWDTNPWIAAISFTVERRNIDAEE